MDLGINENDKNKQQGQVVDFHKLEFDTLQIEA